MTNFKRRNLLNVTVEGTTESEFCSRLRIFIYKCKGIAICKNKKHKLEIKGTLRSNQIIECEECNSFYIIDKDELSEEKIHEFKQICESHDIHLILSNPKFEVILLCAYLTPNESWKNKDKVDELLKIKIKNYEKTKKFIGNFVKILKENKIKEFWEKNIEKLNELKISNFLEFIHFLKQFTNDNN